MPNHNQFDYIKPVNINEALSSVSKYKNPVLLAGGTDLVEMLKEGLLAPDAVIDLKGLESLSGIELENGFLSVGSLVTFTEIIESELVKTNFPVLIEMSKTVASPGIRNRATMTGNICSAVPCSDSGPVLMAYDAFIVAAGLNGERKIPAREWFVNSRKTALMPEEIVTSVLFPVPSVKHSGCFVKLGRYSGEDLAQVNLCILAFSNGEFRFSFGAVAPVPVRAVKIEKLLNGKKITAELIEQAKKLVEKEIKPITDIRASKEYRLHMAKVMLERGLKTAGSRLEGKGPDYCTSII